MFHLHFIPFSSPFYPISCTSVDSLNYHALHVAKLLRWPNRANRTVTAKVWLLGSSDSNQLHHQHCKAILSFFSKSIRSEFPHVRVPGWGLSWFGGTQPTPKGMTILSVWRGVRVRGGVLKGWGFAIRQMHSASNFCRKNVKNSHPGNFHITRNGSKPSV